MAVEAKRTDYEVGVDSEGGLCLDGQTPTRFPQEWTAEHLLLGALAKCVLASLGYHARGDGVDVTADANASGTVTRRDDGRWGFVDIVIEVDARVDGSPDDIPALLGRAERGCFIGASLSPRPTYAWRVNGESVDAGEVEE